MAEKSLQIECPHCGQSISVDQALRSDLESEFEKRFQRQLQQLHDDYGAKEDALAKSSAQLEQQKAHLASEVQRQLGEAKAALEKHACERAQQELGLEMEAVRAELSEKTWKLDEAKRAELELRKKANDLQERERNLELETLRKLDEERSKIREQAIKQASDELQLKLFEKDRQLDEARRQAEEMRRKIEQGSQQSQGEALELTLEGILKQQFPADTIEPVPKGLRGADIIQKVLSPQGQLVGTIVWETKRTKSWSGDWVDKLKEDQREIKAEVAILVSHALPKEVQGFGHLDGIWVSDLKSFLPLALAIRMQLIQLHQVRGAMQNRGEKMEVLYNYLTGTQFKQRVEAIVEGFASMREDLDKEKRAIQRQWAVREQQIGKIVANTVGMYGDLQGMVGANMPRIESLEFDKLPEPSLKGDSEA